MMLLLVYLASTTALLLLAWLVFRNWNKAGLMAFSLMAIHFFFGALQDWLKQSLPGSFPARYSFLLPILLVLVVALFIVLKKKKTSFPRTARYLNLMLLVLVAIETGWLLFSSTQPYPGQSLPGGFTRCDTCSRPDIYVILADEYAGEKQLREQFSFDNSSFLQALNQRGFHTVAHSKSNYNFTPYSIASILDMNYLGNEKLEKRQLLHQTYERTRNNNLLRFLQANGYAFHNLSLLDYKGQPARVDETFLPVRTRLITAQTLLSRINKDLRFNLVTRFRSKDEARRLTYRSLRNNRSLINDTKDLAGRASTQPRFILTHLMMPHYPYYFDRNGSPYPYAQVVEGNQHRANHYIEYLQYSNKIFLDLIDHIQAGSKQPPIIVFLSDHGFRHFRTPVDPSWYFYNHVSLFIPGSDYASFPDSLSGVNIFRALLNDSFGQHLNYLEDTSYIMENP